ncbi:caveolin-3-like [Thalassophryne amazonica]|uniref:caveolin-3-like n=1 Tax=Thalassophryne amazonica TaxID=390379 RepID=UPI001470F9AD|nr:caveolin-3-like [Thalassophryne amazonica]
MNSTEDNQNEEHPEAEESTMIDIDKRDPNNTHRYVIKMEFEDVIAEPSGVHSWEPVWKFSYKTYSGSKKYSYYTLSTILGVPLSLLWGVLFASVSFIHIWTIMPCIKCCELQCQCLKQLSLMWSRIFPCVKSCADMITSLKAAWNKNQ